MFNGKYELRSDKNILRNLRPVFLEYSPLIIEYTIASIYNINVL